MRFCLNALCDLQVRDILGIITCLLAPIFDLTFDFVPIRTQDGQVACLSKWDVKAFKHICLVLGVASRASISNELAQLAS